MPRPKQLPARVMFMAVLPPPVHGQSLCNQTVLQRLAATGCALAVQDTSPGIERRGLRYHATRIARLARGCLRLVLAGAGRQRTLYLAGDAGWGMLYTLAVVALARMAGWKVILHHHIGAYFLKRRRTLALLCELFGPDDRHVVESPRMAENMAKLYRLRAAPVVVPNAAFVPAPAAASPGRRNGTRGKLTVGFLGWVTRAKGIDACLETILLLRQAAVDARLLVAGPVIHQDVQASLDRIRRELPGAVEVVGPVFAEAKEAFYRRLDALLFPSVRGECRPLVLLEAMSHGIPVIARDSGFVGELLEGHGILIPPRADYGKAAAEILTRWHKDEGARIAAGEAVRQAYGRLREDSLPALDSLIDLITAAD